MIRDRRRRSRSDQIGSKGFTPGSDRKDRIDIVDSIFSKCRDLKSNLKSNLITNLILDLR